MPGLKDIKLKKFTGEYLLWSKGAHRENTYELEKQSFNKFFEFLINSEENATTFLLTDVKTKTIDQFMAHFRNNGLKATTVNAYFRHLKAAFSKARIWDYIEENPFFTIKQLRIEKKTPRFIPKEEIGPFIRSIDNFDHRMIISGYIATGRRRGELLSLKWSDIDFEKKRYMMKSSKSHTTKDFPINDEFMNVLDLMARKYGKDASRVFWKWQSPNSITTFVKRELIKGGYPKLKLHDLRHTFASVYLMSGGDLMALKELLGHSNINTTMIYSHLTQSHLDAENNKIKF